MNTDKPDNTTAAAMPDIVQAFQAWSERMAESDRVVRAALDAIRTASPATPPEALISAWTQETAALMRVITELTRTGLGVMEAYQRLLTRP